jgi:large subunit ribosomal protein L18
MKTQKKAELLQKRKWRIRKRIVGTAARPRLCVHFSNKHIYAQCVDDDTGHTVAFLSSLGTELRERKLAANIAGAVELAKAFSERAKAAGITAVVFDRNGRIYHGKVKAFAEAAREGGLEF